MAMQKSRKSKEGKVGTGIYTMPSAPRVTTRAGMVTVKGVGPRSDTMVPGAGTSVPNKIHSGDGMPIGGMSNAAGESRGGSATPGGTSRDGAESTRARALNKGVQPWA